MNDKSFCLNDLSFNDLPKASEIDVWLKSDQRKTAAELHAEAIAYVNRKKGGLI